MRLARLEGMAANPKCVCIGECILSIVVIVIRARNLAMAAVGNVTRGERRRGGRRHGGTGDGGLIQRSGDDSTGE